MITGHCAFRTLSANRVVVENRYCLTIRDGFAVSPGHTSTIPRRHAASFFETTPEERDSILNASDKAKLALDADFVPAAYNIGVNHGPAAGPAVGHLHVHLIPRYAGDHSDTRGVIRWIIPEKAQYRDQV